MQFAIHKLGFAPENILMFGWSIGGWSSLYIATQYPDVKGVVRTQSSLRFLSSSTEFLRQILDATFDDVLQLALPIMPNSLSGIVRIAIREYVNLNNIDLMNNYNGPVLMIRRTEDEVISQ